MLNHSQKTTNVISGIHSISRFNVISAGGQAIVWYATFQLTMQIKAAQAGCNVRFGVER